ncbi:MAG: DegQ family serine endoprotease [Gammaproteobacteria bacterium]
MSSYKPARLLLWWAAVLLQLLPAASALARDLPDFTRLVEQVRPAVVNISTVSGRQTDAAGQSEDRDGQQPPGGVPFDDLLRKFFEDRGGDGIPPVPRESLGSGFIISPDGYILTNRHVVKGADKIVVRLSDRREFRAKLVGMDKPSDIALLKIDASNLPVVRMGDSDRLKVGEWVLAIGSPFGFEHSVTAGIVSAKGRTLPHENYVPFIQTDVAINPGNSGGPLFNLDGQVVGVNSQIFSRTGGYMGLSFAIPSNTAMQVAEQIKTKGRVSRGWLGVYIQDVTGELAESFGLDKPRGALVARVLPGSPAEKAGIRVGDVIVTYQGHAVEQSSALPPMVGATPVGAEARVTVIRDRKTVPLTVTIRELPRTITASESRPPARQKLNQRIGLAVVDPDTAQRKALELGDYGVVVKRVEADSPAGDAGIQAGDGIVMMHGAKVKDARQFDRLVAGLPAGKVVSVLVHRASGPLFVTLKVPAG